ncbi:IclR family pca regulon transcriptional regulator [Saccharopolyspora lacisalsi]|uniref:Glycerol operon regulatory protein n=1 Tax=Halosaccharopolyspora lacisalsi TaxID=1000566 RepID=A0A839DUB3_9PSEU|nr:IclR family transcriptional regulator C-terminal domain-containing protein [Halosaccharopolyspora lacisalsi]MBA8824510.1 IclR family pca regulon transcriptional regulator [Halosaccharopolyspora lacisalsi]
MEPVSDSGAGSVQSLTRGLAVIRAFDESRPEMTLSEVARVTELSRASVRRFLHTLVQLGYVWTDGRVFALTPRVLELGFSYLSSISLPEIAQPHMEKLVSQLHESVSLSVLDGDDIVYVARVPTSRIMTVSINIGTRFPAYATSMGRVLLAHLPEDELTAYLERVEPTRLGPHTVTTVGALRRELERIRAQGWSLVDQELEAGLRSLAAPVRGPAGRGGRGGVKAAVNVSCHAGRTSQEHARKVLLPSLLEAAARIEADLRVAPSARADTPSR